MKKLLAVLLIAGAGMLVLASCGGHSGNHTATGADSAQADSMINEATAAVSAAADSAKTALHDAADSAKVVLQKAKTLADSAGAVLDSTARAVKDSVKAKISR